MGEQLERKGVDERWAICPYGWQNLRTLLEGLRSRGLSHSQIGGLGILYAPIHGLSQLIGGSSSATTMPTISSSIGRLTSPTTDRLLRPRQRLALAAAGLLLAACGHEAYYLNLRTRNLQQADAAVMTELESTAKSLGLVMHAWNERVVVNGRVVSSLTTPDGDPASLEVQIDWSTNPAPGSSGFHVRVGSRARRGLQEAKPRIDQIADRLSKVLTDAFGKDHVSVERDNSEVWIF
jgi:hypothetical protein